MVTKQQQRERAQRRRKLEEFWRWACEESLATEARFQRARIKLPGLCRTAVSETESLWVDRVFGGGTVASVPRELHRDLSLAQLDVLEMLEERVGELALSDAPDHQEHWAGQPYDVVSIGGRSSGKTEQIKKETRDGTVVVLYPEWKPFPPPPPVLM